MRKLEPRSVLALCALLAAALVAVPVAADWLVTEEGGRVETRGAWEVKGRLVVFTTVDGDLSSMRLDDVDLEASRDATREAMEAAAAEAAPAVEEEAPAPKPRRKITDADIPPGEGQRSRPSAAAPPEGGDGGDGDAGSEVPAGPAADLVVTSSEAETAPDGSTLVRGRLANRGREPAVGVRLDVNLYGFDGELLATNQARLGSTALAAGEETSFVAEFGDTFSYGAMSFDPRGTALATSPAEEDTDDGDGGPGAEGEPAGAET